MYVCVVVSLTVSHAKAYRKCVYVSHSLFLENPVLVVQDTLTVLILYHDPPGLYETMELVLGRVRQTHTYTMHTCTFQRTNAVVGTEAPITL